ncbi:MAG: UDP-N-acetylmuramoyl-tripeptide--D-alanyl-D-alanine ligase, partial [Candidatus Cloacimonadaceae bacterium]|nr:UDP-N-acetylmuramoyl-tripeptide--D-alanyl-D-alanine ligase [Candidatus Cloacimonadaceae bacterium]
TIRRIKPEHEYAVFEIGTNHFGEIKALADICMPDCGIITNIGPSHLEALIDEDGVYREKTALFDRPLDLRLFDANDSRFAEYRSIGRGVGTNEDADYRIHDVSRLDETTSFSLNDAGYSIPYPFFHFVGNAAYAISLGLHLSIPVEVILQAISRPLDLGLRMNVEHCGNSVIIADCYNANPLSMQKAIEFWRELQPDKPHIAILGDMLELGSAAESYHAMIGAILSEGEYDRLISVGDLSRAYHPETGMKGGAHFSDVAQLIESEIINEIKPGCIVLVKGSHGIHLEQTLAPLKKGLR